VETVQAVECSQLRPRSEVDDKALAGFLIVLEFMPGSLRHKDLMEWHGIAATGVNAKKGRGGLCANRL
jgi:hypothetical protein